VNSGICVPSPSVSSSASSSASEPLSQDFDGKQTFACDLLFKEQCDRYVNLNNSDIKLSIVDDGPCFFNGIKDGELLCIKKSSLESSDCKDIKTNSIIRYEGEERESCNEAHMIFGMSLMCGWVNRFHGESGHCGHIYFLTANGFSFFLYFSLFF
jgi:hypothetical protein